MTEAPVRPFPWEKHYPEGVGWDVEVDPRPVPSLLRDAAAADPAVTELWGRIQIEFRENQRAVVADLERRGALRPGLDVERAADILWTLNHPDVQRLLVHERGWTPEEHERWTADVLCAELLAVRRGGAADGG